MKDIKVKVWDTHEKKWLTDPKVVLIHKEKTWGTEFYLEIDEDWESKNYDPTRYIFIQSTGLKDCHGQEIYEGDIIKAWKNEQQRAVGWEIIEQVYRQRGGFKLFGKPMQDISIEDDGTIKWLMFCEHGHMNIPDIFYEITNFEIIGNIYQNPELLK